MAIKFNPTGYLNLTADPQDLPEQADQKNIVSGAMVRCKNLDLNYEGKAITRKGSSLKSLTACNEVINHIQILDDNRYEFGGDQIFKNESSIETSLNAADWDSFIYLAYNDTAESIFATNGVDRKRIQGSSVYEWGIDAPTAAPTARGYITYSVTYDWELTYVSDGFQFTQSSGNYDTTYTWEIAVIEGTSLFAENQTYCTTSLFEVSEISDTDKFQVKYTYARYDGSLLMCESNPSPAAETTMDNYIYVDWVASSDTSVTHVRFYRTLANFGDFYYCDEFDITDTYGILGTTDENLGSLVDTDHDRVPSGGTVLCGPDFNGIAFLGVGKSIYFSKSKQPEYWPALYNVECGTDQYPVVGLALLGGQLFAANKHEIYQIQGTGSASFFPLPMAAITGTRSRNVFLPVKGYGIFHLGYDGLYLYTGSTDIKISNSFDCLWKNETKNGVPYINKLALPNCIMRQYENKVWFGYPGPDSTYCDNWLTIELQSNLLQGITGKVQYYTYPWYVSAMQIDENNSDVLVADTDGYIRKLDDISKSTDNDTSIDWEIESKAFGNLRKFFPRWSRYDIDLINGASANGYVLLNETVKQIHPITDSRNTRKRLITGCTGDRVSIRMSGSGPVEIYSAEIE